MQVQEWLIERERLLGRIKELEARLEYLEAENDYLKKLDALLQQKEQMQKMGGLPKKKCK